MLDDTAPPATLFDPFELELAASACCGRFGEPVAEMQRLVTLRGLIAGSTALAHELEAFSKAAAAHLRGVHCTASMHPEAERLSRAVAAWSEEVEAAANAHRDWLEQRTLTELGVSRLAHDTLPEIPAIGAVQLPIGFGPSAGPAV